MRIPPKKLYGWNRIAHATKSCRTLILVRTGFGSLFTPSRSDFCTISQFALRSANRSGGFINFYIDTRSGSHMSVWTTGDFRCNCGNSHMISRIAPVWTQPEKYLVNLFFLSVLQKSCYQNISLFLDQECLSLWVVPKRHRISCCCNAIQSQNSKAPMSINWKELPTAFDVCFSHTKERMPCHSFDKIHNGGMQLHSAGRDPAGSIVALY